MAVPGCRGHGLGRRGPVRRGPWCRRSSGWSGHGYRRRRGDVDDAERRGVEDIDGAASVDDFNGVAGVNDVGRGVGRDGRS